MKISASRPVGLPAVLLPLLAWSVLASPSPGNAADHPETTRSTADDATGSPVVLRVYTDYV